MKKIVFLIIRNIDVTQFIRRNGKFFPPYALILFFLSLVAITWIQRLLGINNISDMLMSVITGVVFLWVSVFWIIDNNGNPPTPPTITQ